MPHRLILILVGLAHLVTACAGAPPASEPRGAGFDAEAALRREAEPIELHRYVTRDERLRIEVPARPTAVPDTDGYYGVELDIGAESAVVCFVYPDGINLANAVGAMAESMLGPESEIEVEARQIAGIDAGEVDGHPYLGAQWIYRETGQDGSPLLGQLTVYGASKADVGVACLQNEVGFEATFRRVFEAVVASLTLERDVSWPPYYVELATFELGGQHVGVMQFELSLDSEGDTRIATTSSMVMPTSPGEVATSDEYGIEYSTDAGQLINMWYQSVEAGALKTELALGRESENTWSVSGTYEQKDLEATIEAGTLTSTLGKMRELRDAIRTQGVGCRVVYPVWIADADPTRLIETSVDVGERLSDQEFEAVAKIGPVSITGVVDDTGSLRSGKMKLGPVDIHLERIYRSGEF